MSMYTQTYTKTLAGGMIGLALLGTVASIPRAEAATMTELQAQIQALLARVQALQGAASPAASAATCGPFTSDLALGRSGSSVIDLQKFLMQRGYAIPAGATGYFGAQTQSALVQFQRAQGIVPAIGYFGLETRTKVNAVCTPSTPSNSNTSGGTGSGSGGNTSTGGLSGEASFEKFDVQSGDETNLEEGMKGVGVMDIEFDVRDGDARVNRIDLGFTPHDTNTEKDPWDTFSEVSIYDGSTRLARVDASTEKNWSEDEPSEGSYRLRLSGINWLLKEGDTAALTVKVSTGKSIKGTQDGEGWDIFVPTNGIRAVDADRANVYAGDSADTVSLDIDKAGNKDEVIVKRSNGDPDSTTLQLQDDTRSDWMTIFGFDLDTDNSTNAIEIRKIPVELTVSSSTVGVFMRDIRLVANGKTYTQKTITDGSTNTALFTFDRGEFVIDAGKRVPVKVQVSFKPLDAANEGVTIEGSVRTTGIVAKGADTLASNQISGAATGEMHTLRTSGAVLENKSSTAVLKYNSGDTKDDDQGVYSVSFDVTAFERDLFIAPSATRGTTLSSGGVNFVIQDASSGQIETASGTVQAVLNSNARMEGGYFKVPEGETRSFTLMVVYDPEYESFFRVQLQSLNWNTIPDVPVTEQRALPAQNFETVSLSI